jgi:hypothetical protein
VIGLSHGFRSRQKPAEEEQMKKFVRCAVAGTTALNAVGCTGMALRGRSASSVPALVAEQLASRVGGTIPGSGAARQNRLEGLGALAGIATGAGVGALADQLQGAVRRLGPLVGPAVIGGVAAMLVADLTMAASADGSEGSRAGDAEREPGELASAEPAPPATPATPAFEVLQRAAVLGAATGMRSTVALAALILRRSHGLPAVLRNPPDRRDRRWRGVGR